MTVFKALGLTAVFISAITLSGAYAAEDIDMGPINGATYYAEVSPSPSADTVCYKVVQQVMDERGVINEVVLPAVDRYYAGVQPGGPYYFFSGETEPEGSDFDPVQFLYIYELGGNERVLESTGEIGESFTREFGWDGGKLYTVAIIGGSDTLYEADPVKGTVIEVFTASSLKLPTGGYAYYTEKGPDNSAAIEKFRGTPGPYQLEPIDCICCGGSGYDVHYRMDLATRETENAFDVSATSTLIEPGKPADYLGPEKAVDGDITTAWVEGADGAGVGESITIDFGGTLGVYGVGIFPGFGKDPRIYYGNNRVKKVRLEFSDGTKIIESFDDEVGLRVIDCHDYTDDDSIGAEWLEVTILEVNKGLEWNDTAISEVAINPY